MRILLHGSAFWTKNAYGLQLRHAIDILRELGVEDIGQSCTFGFQGRKMDADRIALYPSLIDGWGNDVIALHAADFQADYVLSLGDVFGCDPNVWGKTFRWLSWATVDSRPLWPSIQRGLTNAKAVIGYSQFGQQVLNEAGIPAGYIPLAYDPGVYYPDDQAQARERARLPGDRYIVAMVQANRQKDNRKAFFAQLEGFAKFHAAHPDSWLYLYTCINAARGGFDLEPLLANLGLEHGRDYGVANQYKEVVVGSTDDEMRDVYNSCDVLLQATKAEGFGVPALEAQACGKPVVFTDYAALSEVVKFGYAVDYEREWQPFVASWYAAPRVDSIADALARAYRGETERVGSVDEYSLPHVARTYWRPFVQALRDELDHETQPVKAAA